MRSAWDFTHKKGSFGDQKIVFFPKFGWKFISKNLILNTFVIFDQKFQNVGSSDDKFAIFDQKLKKHGTLW